MIKTFFFVLSFYVLGVASVLEVNADKHDQSGEIQINCELNEEKSITVQAVNKMGHGPFSDPKSGIASEQLVVPRGVAAEPMSGSSVIVSWDQSETSNDNDKLYSYRIKYREVQSRRKRRKHYHRRRAVDASEFTNEATVPVSSCTIDEKWVKNVEDYINVAPNKCNHVIGGLKKGSTYQIIVSTQANGGSVSLYSDPIKITVEDPEYLVQDLTFGYNSDKNLKATWKYQRPSNFKNYKIFVFLRKTYLKVDGQFEYLRFPMTNGCANMDENDDDTLLVDKCIVKPTSYWGKYSNITIYVYVRTLDNVVHWPASASALTRLESPEHIEAPTLYDNDVTSFGKEVTFTPTSHENGPVSKYWLIVMPLDYALFDKETKFLLNSHFNRQTNRGSKLPEKKPWIAAEFNRSELVKYSIDTNKFKLGADSETTVTTDARNFKLMAGKEYVVFLRAFVSDGRGDQNEKDLYNDSPKSEVFKTWSGNASPNDPKRSDLWIVGPVVAIIVIGIIVLILIIAFMKRQRKRQSPSKGIGPISKVAMGDDPYEGSKLLTDVYANQTVIPTTFDPPAYQQQDYPDGGGANYNRSYEMKSYGSTFQPTSGMMNRPPVPIAELSYHIERLKENDNLLFSQEYESIDPDQNFTWENSNFEMNKPKNRYANVIAYDHSRCVLSVVDSQPGSDYVNANYIDGYHKPKAYIATQGPLPETFDDFWRMTWEENCAVIVMLTKLEERTRVKCDQYWPQRGSHHYGLMSVTVKETVELAHYTIRTFQIQKANSGQVREVKQLQFTAWPDHGVPEHPTPFLMFLKRVKSINPHDAGPIVVHCSAGVGRTGAFIVIDCMLDRIRNEQTIDIYGTVTMLRSQRNYMVQTEDQYIFIHDAVLDAVLSGSTEVPISKLFTHLQKLLMYPDQHLSATGMELEFRHLTSLKMLRASINAASLPCNKAKNRLVNILPYDSTRVCLRPLAGQDGSDYINASFIDGYRFKRAYIATQGPMQTTDVDMWRMLWEHGSTLVVMLTQLAELGREKCYQYWPSERATLYGKYSVDPIAEYHMPAYILREFKMTNTTDGNSRTVRHFQYIDWPEQGVPKSAENFIDFIGQVHKTKEQFGQDGPIASHCSTGVGRTGVFVALAIILERMRYESVVDVFTTVKLLRTQRIDMVQTEEQYNFLYQAALEYLGSFDHYAMQ